MEKKSTSRGFLAVLLASVFGGPLLIWLVESLAAEGWTGGQVTLIRSLLGALLTLFFIRGRSPTSARKDLWVILANGVGSGWAVVAVLTAISLTPAISPLIIFLVYLAVVWVALVSHLRGQRLSGTTKQAIGLFLLGAVITGLKTSTGTTGNPCLSVLLAVSASIGVAIAIFTAKELRRREYAPTVIVRNQLAITSVMAAACWLAGVFPASPTSPHLTGYGILAFLGLGLFSGVLYFWLLNFAIGHLTPVNFGVMTFCEPGLAVLAGFYLLSKPLTFTDGIACTLMLIGGISAARQT